MFSFLFAAWALSHVAAQEQFFWSYKVENTTGSYAPLFEICGSSCSDCDPEAKACFAENWSNLCFEPKLGETCCKDQFGTSCYDGYYCAYDEDNIAFCCANDDDEDDCAKALNVTLDNSNEPKKVSPTVSVTAIFTPSITSGQSVVPRPDRTQAPIMPGGSKGKGDPEDLEIERDVSTSVKVGIAVGAFVGVAILVTLVIMCIIHRRKVARYSALAEQKPMAAFRPTSAHPGEHGIAIAPAVSPVPSPYEPMRSQTPHDPHDSWRISPAISPAISRDPSPHQSPRPAYVDRYSPSPHQHHTIELTHMPPATSPGMGGPGHDR